MIQNVEMPSCYASVGLRAEFLEGKMKEDLLDFDRSFLSEQNQLAILNFSSCPIYWQEAPYSQIHIVCQLTTNI